MITETEMRIQCLRVAFDDACRAAKRAWQDADRHGANEANRASGKYAMAYAADDKAAAIRRELVEALESL